MKRLALLVVLVLFSVFDSIAQCAMCRAVLENEEGQSAAEGINDGIMYLMSIPYILLTALGVLIYFKFFRKKSELQ